MGKFKIIWHFKSYPENMQDINEIKKAIKEFHEKSIVLFSDDLEIKVIEEETDIAKKFKKELNDINNNPLYEF